MDSTSLPERNERDTDEGDASVTVDVAVIGAGIAGATLAAAIERAGHTVALLEARDRVGGRLLGHRHNGARVDLGATWFWPNEPRVQALAARFGLDTFAQHLAGDALFHQPGTGQRIEGNPLDTTSGRFRDSAQSLVEHVVEELGEGTLRLDTPVHRIATAPGGQLRVDHAHGSVTARHVALAVPPALAAASIDFEPALPDRLRGLIEVTPVWMGAIAKVVAIYATPFWRAAGLAGAAISHLGPMREIHDMSGPDGSPAALFGFAPGSLDQPTASAQACLDQLVELFGPEAAEPIDLVVHDWRAEPWTSPPEVERLTAYQAFGHPLFGEPALDGRLHWCSTETATVAPGHIEGALAAAERAASAILSDLTSTQSTKDRS